MNEWQLASQIEYLLDNAEWPDGEKFVRKAYAVPIDNFGLLEDQQPPFAAIRVGGTQAFNREFEDEIEVTFDIDLIIDIHGNKTGRSSLMGKDRTTGAKGRGVLEAQDVLLSTLTALTESNGVKFGLQSISMAGVVPLGDRAGVFRTFTFAAFGTQQRSYNKPIRVRNPSGLTITWQLPGDRFDFKLIKLRRHTSQLTAITDGTNLALASDTSVTFTDVGLGAGTYWYGVFAGYDDVFKSDPDLYVYSPPVNIRVVVA